MKAATAEAPAHAPARAEARAQTSARSTEAPAGVDLLTLQHQAGNLAVGRMLAGVPRGSGERQANLVADAFVGRRPDAPGERAWLTIGPTAPRAVPASVVDVLATQGHALDPGSRAAFERQIGGALGSVRVHTDARAAASARDLRARAYTFGPHVVFGPGFAPSTTEGRHLLAHEFAHVAQQRHDRPALQLAPEDGAAAAPSATPGRDALKAALLSQLTGLALPPLGFRLAFAAGGGMGEEIIKELRGQKGVALLASLRSFSLPDVGELNRGFGVGLLSGIVSPVTDLFSIAILGEKVRNFLLAALANPMSARDGLAEDVQALLLEIGELGQPAADAWKEISKSPRDALIFILKLPDTLSDEAEAKAYELGKAGGAAVLDSVLQPFGLGTPEKQEEQPSWVTETAGAVGAGVKWLKDLAVGASPWAKVGEKVGYALGWVAIQVILFAFTDGIGDAIQWLAQGLGKIAEAFGTVSEAVGRVAAKVAEAVKTIGEGIAVAEEWFGKIISKLLKPAEKFLEPVLKALGGVRDKLRTVLTKLFGITRKESTQLAEAAAAKAAKKSASAVDEALERTGPKGAPKTVPEPKPVPPEVPPGEGALAEGAVAKPPEPVREPVKGGHHVEVREEGIELCSTDPCPLLGVEYRTQLDANEELANRLAAVEKLRATDPQAAAKAAAELRESLEFIRNHPEVFAALPAHVTPQQQARLAELLRRAEDAGAQLGEKQLRDVAAAFGQTNDPAAVTDMLDAVEARLGGEAFDPFADAAQIGGGSREGDLAKELPEGAPALGRAAKNPEEVAGFLHRNPKVNASPESEAALDGLFEGRKSGSPERTPWHGRELPSRTGGAEGELRSIEDLASRPEVEQIQLVPSTSEERMTDKILDIREPPGTGPVRRVRYEDTATVGAVRGPGKSAYRPYGEPRLEAEVEDIAGAVEGKIKSTVKRPSQFNAPRADAPEGGILAVHIQNPSPTAGQDVVDAMKKLQPKLRASTLESVEFFLPGQPPIRYVRGPGGRFIPLKVPVAAGGPP